MFMLVFMFVILLIKFLLVLNVEVLIINCYLNIFKI